MGYEERANQAAANTLRQVRVVDAPTLAVLVDEPGRRVAFDGQTLMWRREDGSDCMYRTRPGDLVTTTTLEQPSNIVTLEKRVEVVQ